MRKIICIVTVYPRCVVGAKGWVSVLSYYVFNVDSIIVVVHIIAIYEIDVIVEFFACKGNPVTVVNE